MGRRRVQAHHRPGRLHRQGLAFRRGIWLADELLNMRKSDSLPPLDERVVLAETQAVGLAEDRKREDQHGKGKSEDWGG